ncbi:MAG: electron transfer flavoprotein subunit alpha/FixB family protein [Gemmatimonadetes bacterium]|nr:electron transfer flavoprotein subunit alpha/FixB family protein [Gemmatimonadota bacterium]
MANILAVAESRGGELRKVACEAVTAARAIAGGGEVHALLLGAPGIAGKAAQLGEFGADAVIVTEHAAFALHNPEAASATIAERVKSGGYRAVVLPASAHGKDLAPRVAAKLGVGIAADVTSMRMDGDVLVAAHPVNTGKVIANIRSTANPAVVSVRPGAITPVAAPRAPRIEAGAAAGDPSAARVRCTGVTTGNTARLDLGEAPIIVTGGRGLKAAEHFRLVEDLAAAFGNAAVGATRAVTDDGWRPHSDQIGQTGRLVSPDLYVAVGVSGAIQHLAGMRTSKTIVAINKDKEAPIFKVADYGIVGDAFEVVPRLTEAVKAARAAR